MKSLALSFLLVAAATVFSPTARAGMLIGNYEVHTPRDPSHSWLWAVRKCEPGHPAECIHVQAIPRPNGQATPWNGDGSLANGHYTMVIDVPDGVRCTIYFLPSHDVYTWDAETLTGSVHSTFDAGCGGAPGGSADYPFELVRY